MGVFSYLKDLLGKEPESSKEDVYVVDPEFEESKDKGDTGQNSSGDSTDGESEKGSEVDSVKDHSHPRETASTEPEGLIKDKGTLAHLLEEEKRSGSSTAPRVGEEEIAHSFAAEDLAEDSEDEFEVPESEVSESGDSRREDSGSWGEQSGGSAAARVESGAEGVNGTPHAAVGDEDVVDTDSDEGVVLRIEDDSDGSAEGEVVVPEGSGSSVVESEGVADGSGVAEDADSVVKSVGVAGGLDHVEGPEVKSEDKTAEGVVSSSEAAEVEASVVEPVDGAEDVEHSAVESASSEDVEAEAPAVETEGETSEVEGVESVAAVSTDEDSSSEHAEDLVVKPVGGIVESERAGDLVVKPVGGIVESEPAVTGGSEDTPAAGDGMDLVPASGELSVEAVDEDKAGSSLDSGEQVDGLGSGESVDLGTVADEGEHFESSEAEETDSRVVDVEDTRSPVVEEIHSPVVEETDSAVVEEAHSPVVEETDSAAVEGTDSLVVEAADSAAVEAEDTHSPVVEGADFSAAEDAVEPGARDAVSGGGVVSGGEETLDVKSEGQTLGLDVDEAAEPSEGVSVADGSYGSMSVVPWSVYMARQSEEAADTEGEDQENATAGEDVAVADQSGVEEVAATVEPENGVDSVDEGGEQLIVADEEPVEATVAPGLSLDGEDGVEGQDRDDVSFVSDTDEDTASETVDEDSDESVSEPSDLLDEDEGGEFIEAEDSDESEGSSSVVKSELEVDPSLIEGSDESETKKGESDGGLHISIPGF